MLELVISLWLSSMILMFLASVFFQLFSLNQRLETVNQIHLATLQLQHRLNRANNWIVETSSLCFDFETTTYCLLMDQNRLIKTPGYEVILVNIDALSFTQEANRVYMHVNWQQKDYKIMLLK